MNNSTNHPKGLSFETSNNRKNLIIFIHGLFGGKETWVKKDDNKSILDYLKKDENIATNFDFAVFDYFTKPSDKVSRVKGIFQTVFGVKDKQFKNIDVPSIAKILLSEVEFLHADYNNIVLITHSMGGLIAKAMILEEISIHKKTSISLYVSLAVPHKGSLLANWGGLFLGSPQIKNLQPLSELIDSLTQQWLNASGKLPQTIYFQGQHDQIVSKVAAKGHEIEISKIVYTDDDHFSIVRPGSKDDVVIRSITKYLKTLLDLKVHSKPSAIEKDVESQKFHLTNDDVLPLYEVLKKGLTSPIENIATIEKIANSNDERRKSYLYHISILPYISFLEVNALDIAISAIESNLKVKNLYQELKMKEVDKLEIVVPQDFDPTFRDTYIKLKYWRYITRKNFTGHDDMEKFISIIEAKGFNDEALQLSKKMADIFREMRREL